MKLKKPDFPTTIITPVFRLSYPNVFEPKYNELAKRNEYNIQMLFDKKTAQVELKDMSALVSKIILFVFGAGPKGLRKPFQDGDTITSQSGELKKEKNPSYTGNIIVNSWTKNKPGVVNSSNKPIIDADEIYGGCYCRAQLNAYAYNTAGSMGINFGLLHVQKVRDGEPFGVRSNAEDAFAPIAEESLAEDATADSMFD